MPSVIPARAFLQAFDPPEAQTADGKAITLQQSARLELLREAETHLQGICQRAMQREPHRRTLTASLVQAVLDDPQS